MNRRTRESVVAESLVDWHKYWKDKALEERAVRLELEKEVQRLQKELVRLQTRLDWKEEE